GVRGARYVRACPWVIVGLTRKTAATAAAVANIKRFRIDSFSEARSVANASLRFRACRRRFGSSPLVDARATQDRLHAVVALVTRVLVDTIVSSRHRNRHGERSRVHGRIRYCVLIG